MNQSYIKIIVATLLFSLGPLFVKILPLDAISILWAVSFVAAIALTLKLLVQKRVSEFFSLSKAGLLLLISLGVITTINNVFFNLAIKSTTIANAVLAHYLAPVFLLFFGVYLFKERIEKKSLVALAFSLLGLIVLLAPQNISLDNTHFIGLLFGTFSAIFFASEIAFRKKLSHTYRADMITAVFFLFSTLILLPFVAFDEIVRSSPKELIALLMFGTLIVGAGVSLHTSGIRKIKAQYVGVLNYIEPLGAILWGFWIVSEVPSLSTLIGGSLILLSGYIIIKRGKFR